MGISTVSGPFRSANGFQELVNGVWTPVSGGGGNPNDIVVSGKIYPNDGTNIWGAPTSCSPFGPSYGNCFFVDTGFTMQEIQDSLASNGKWACFSGYEMVVQLNTSTPNPDTNYQMSCVTGWSVQTANCVYNNAGNYILASINSCGNRCPPTSQMYNTPYYFDMQWSSNFISDGTLMAGLYCACTGFPGDSLSCTAKLFLYSYNAGLCGLPFPAVQYNFRLKFDRLVGQN